MLAIKDPLKEPKDKLCQLHCASDEVVTSQDHLKITTATTIPPIYCSIEGCNELAAPKAVKEGHFMCSKHKSPENGVPVCAFVNIRPRNGITGCNKPLSEIAVKRCYQLCYTHYTEHCKSAKRDRIEAYKIDSTKADELLMLFHTEKVNREGTMEVCEHTVMREKKKEICGRKRATGSIYCSMHTQIEEKKRTQPPKQHRSEGKSKPSKS
jgi:hypothetical protein